MKTHSSPHSLFFALRSRWLMMLLLALLPSAASAQTVPLLINYQGKVTDSAGAGLGTGTPVNRKVIFRIFDAATSGTRLWSEQQTVTLSNGEFSVLLGSGIDAVYNSVTETPRPALDTVFTSSGTGRYLEIVVDNGDNTLNASDAAITPRQQVTSTAYSFRARAADTIAGSSDLTINPTAAAISGGSVAANYGIGWYGTGRAFNGTTIDGPVLYGFSGGALGSVNGASQVTALRWNATGQVGIGSPDLAGSAANTKLVLQGDDNGAPPTQLSIRGSTTTKRLLVGYNTTNNYGALQAYNGASTATNLVLNQAGGSVGIGNPSPTAILDVTGGIKATGAGGFSFNTGDTDGGLFSPLDGVLTLNTNGAEKVRVDASGNVGIGITAPLQKLHVVGQGVFASSSVVTDPGGAIGPAVLVGFNTAGDYGYINSVYTGVSPKNLALQPIAGNVGIGTPTPASKLVVQGDATASTEQIRIQGASNPNKVLLMSFNTTNNYACIQAVEAGVAGRNLVLNPGQDGNIGIGTTTPGAKLHIKANDNSRNSGIRLEQFNSTHRWNIHNDINGNTLIFSYDDQFPSINYSYLAPSQAGLITVSDRRTKKDIATLENCLAKVMLLHPTTFRYKTALADSPLNYGFIAQEVESVFPEVVLEHDGLKTLAMNSLIAINTQAIRELHQEKEAEVKELQAENAALKARLEILEAKEKARDAKLAAIEKALLSTGKRAAQTAALKKSDGAE